MSEAIEKPWRFSLRGAVVLWSFMWLGVQWGARDDGCSPYRRLPKALWLYGWFLVRWVRCGDAALAVQMVMGRV